MVVKLRNQFKPVSQSVLDKFRGTELPEGASQVVVSENLGLEPIDKFIYGGVEDIFFYDYTIDDETLNRVGEVYLDGKKMECIIDKQPPPEYFETADFKVKKFHRAHRFKNSFNWVKEETTVIENGNLKFVMVDAISKHLPWNPNGFSFQKHENEDELINDLAYHVFHVSKVTLKKVLKGKRKNILPWIINQITFQEEMRGGAIEISQIAKALILNSFVDLIDVELFCKNILKQEKKE